MPDILGKNPNVTCRIMAEELGESIFKNFTKFYAYGQGIALEKAAGSCTTIHSVVDLLL